MVWEVGVVVTNGSLMSGAERSNGARQNNALPGTNAPVV